MKALIKMKALPAKGPMMKKTLPKRNVPIKRKPLRPAGRKYA